jgi:hypothetical protein
MFPQGGNTPTIYRFPPRLLRFHFMSLKPSLTYFIIYWKKEDIGLALPLTFLFLSPPHLLGSGSFN